MADDSDSDAPGEISQTVAKTKARSQLLEQSAAKSSAKRQKKERAKTKESWFRQQKVEKKEPDQEAADSPLEAEPKDTPEEHDFGLMGDDLMMGDDEADIPEDMDDDLSETDKPKRRKKKGRTGIFSNSDGPKKVRKVVSLEEFQSRAPIRDGTLEYLKTRYALPHAVKRIQASDLEKIARKQAVRKASV